jgi:hypothetical protein
VNVTRTERPSTLPAAWAPVSAASPRSDQLALERLVGDLAARNLPAVGASQLPQVHQLSGQAAQAQARVRLVPTAAGYGTNGTTGFRGDDMATGKQIVGRVSGAPPRGRPV